MNPQQAVNDLLKSGWTQIDLALEVGTSQPTIHRIKSGANRRGVPFELAMALITLADGLQGKARVKRAVRERRAP
jgi:hypothetical protein